MSGAAVTLKKLAERVLAKGSDLPLALLLEHVVSVRRLRSLARKHGLSPKGGFRIDRAPAHVIAPLLAEQREPSRLDEVLGLLMPDLAVQPAPAAESQSAVDAAAMLALREAEIVRLREEVERARESAARTQKRETELAKRLEQAERDGVVLRQAVDRSHRPVDRDASNSSEHDLRRRLRELEGEREGFLAADEALRRQLAHNQSRLRELEVTASELRELVPKGRRRQKQAAAEPAPPLDRVFRLPYFLPSFYKSLEGKERRAVERTFQAVLLFCTEGHSYPGLEVKQMGGQDTWSLRASLGLRVYFRPRSDGDIELMEMADREEQHTTLRRLKER